MLRLVEHYEQMPNHGPLLKNSPRDVVVGGDQCFISRDPDETTIEYVIDLIGEGRVIYVSDYLSFDVRFPDSVRCLAERDELSDSAKRKIPGENALRLHPRLG